MDINHAAYIPHFRLNRSKRTTKHPGPEPRCRRPASSLRLETWDPRSDAPDDPRHRSTSVGKYKTCGSRNSSMVISTWWFLLMFWWPVSFSAVFLHVTTRRSRRSDWNDIFRQLDWSRCPIRISSLAPRLTLTTGARDEREILREQLLRSNQFQSLNPKISQDLVINRWSWYYNHQDLHQDTIIVVICIDLWYPKISESSYYNSSRLTGLSMFISVSFLSTGTVNW